LVPFVEYAIPPAPSPPAPIHKGGGSVVTLPVAVFVPLALPGTLSPFTGYTVNVYGVLVVMPLNATGNVDVLVPETGVTPAVGVYVMYTLLNA